MLVHVFKSIDNGKNFQLVSDDVVQVENQTKFIFLNETVGFISAGKMDLTNSKGLYVTKNGGKSFEEAIFQYVNEKLDFLSLEDMPYYENDILKIKCSIYQFDTNKDQYENKELWFISTDYGFHWTLEY